MSAHYTYISLFKEPLPLDAAGQNSAVVSKIVIPRIQRPYAQGRSIPESESVRKNFLKEIFSVLKGESDDLDLNFVYGRLENRRRDDGDCYVMQLLDGQQRLTTLFLLHWYLFNREAVADQDYVKALSSFSYETRETSTAFCAMLGKQVESGRVLQFFQDAAQGVPCHRPPRDVLRSSLHYVHAFDQDPTVSAMLTMLDAIDEEYNKDCPIETHKDYWRRLDRIRFAVLSLTQYKLSEELYIKMNARGLPLSPFDCFKADFLSLMDLPNVKERTDRLVHLNTGLDAEPRDADAVAFKQYFATKLDCSWCDLFWRREDPDRYDSSYMLFFSRYFAARYLLEHQQDIQGKKWQEDKQLDILFFHKLHEEDRVHYHGIAPFAKMVGDFGNGISYFDDIAILLNLLKCRKGELLEAMKPLWQPADYVQPDYFCDGSVPLQQIPLVILSSVIAFIHEFPSCPSDIFRVWMKVVNNVVENTNIDNYTPVAATAGKLALVIRLIAGKKPTSELEFYRAMASIKKELIGATAIEEEIEKACRIGNEKDAKPEAWISLFDDIAKHPFLKGMIGFYYSKTMSLPVFRAHAKLIGSFFGEDGIVEAYRGTHHYLLRAIFAQIRKLSELDGRYVVEDATKKYLKNLISSLKDDELRERMHNLFAVKLLGKDISAPGAASPAVETALREAIAEAPVKPQGETWDTVEALSVLRNDERFYAWAFDQPSLVHVYRHWDQIICRAPKKWACVMMSVFRFAENIADALGMEKIPSTDGRNGYSERYGMYVGQNCQMRKELPNLHGVYVLIRFYADYNVPPYPVEVSIRWPKTLLTKEQGEQIRSAFSGDEVGAFGVECYTRIGTWTFSAEGEGEKTVAVEQIKAKVAAILNKQDMVFK